MSTPLSQRSASQRSVSHRSVSQRSASQRSVSQRTGWRTPSVLRWAVLGGLLIAASVTTGCNSDPAKGIIGTWEADFAGVGARPLLAEGQAPLPRVMQLTFNADRTFSANASHGEDGAARAGDWELVGFEDEVLTVLAGADQLMEVQIIGDDTITVTDGSVTLDFQRVE